MTRLNAPSVPADPTSKERLAARGLDYRTVDTADRDAFLNAMQAVTRGFLGPEITGAAVAEESEPTDGRRYLGIFDAGLAQPQVPVATIDSWVTPLSVPGGDLDMWAISGVTVAGTHRGRGIARAMLEGELRAAAGAGLAIAGLTVTETTLYGRYGFGAAVPMSTWTIDTRRAGWAGPEVDGRVEFVSREQLATDLGDVHERVRTRRGGEIAAWPRRWRQAAGLSTSVKDGDHVRGVRYVDADGEVRGALAYRVIENEREFTQSRLNIGVLVTENPDAAAALWGYAVQHALVAEVTASLRPIDDPVRWLVRDERGAVQTIRDHGWLRILDLPRALESRSYATAADVTLEVTDPLGLTSGTWRVRIAPDGGAEVTRLPAAVAVGAAGASGAAGAGDAGTSGAGDAGASGAPGAIAADIRLGIAELSAAYLGGTPLTGLLASGRIAGEPAAVAALDAALRPAQPPTLSIWY
ncbi:GNAT family N-acetyltransferase [Occultella glacieicola]|uniref:GNAT family N-acetyltransferase n=1 Tax=Occultella glacieicola TaxID=2518684 RepID=A0ABY2E0L4_9MICO|nr:GNAT family N-acetyltransferase [Occultella glacieicola]TDE91496.1 GNAT family N-acetyltransferase [Occultella glacieicola]